MTSKPRQGESASSNELDYRVFPSRHRNTTSMINTSKRRSSEQVKVTGYATDTVQMDVESETTAWASDDDFASSRVTVENMPIAKRALTKKQRH